MLFHVCIRLRMIEKLVIISPLTSGRESHHHSILPTVLYSTLLTYPAFGWDTTYFYSTLPMYVYICTCIYPH